MISVAGGPRAGRSPHRVRGQAPSRRRGRRAHRRRSRSDFPEQRQRTLPTIGAKGSAAASGCPAKPDFEGIAFSMVTTCPPAPLHDRAPHRPPPQLSTRFEWIQRDGGGARFQEERSRMWGAEQGVVKLDRLKDRPQLVVAVRPRAEDAEIQIDLRMCPDQAKTSDSLAALVAKGRAPQLFNVRTASLGTSMKTRGSIGTLIST